MSNQNPNQAIKAICEAKRLRIEKIIHLGSLASRIGRGGSMHDLESDLEDLIGNLETKQTPAHLLESIPGLVVDGEQAIEDAHDFVSLAEEAGKLGFVIEIHTPAIDDTTTCEGSWGWLAVGYFYGETLLEALEVAAERMPAIADRRKRSAA